jgi:Spy/CpxP family protein refolding chaperone
MKMNKTRIAAIGVLGLAAVSAIILMNPNSGSGNAAAGGPAGDRSGAAAGSGAGQDDDSPSKTGDRTRTRQAPANADLIAKYGEARTNLSKHVSTNMVGIMDDVVKMGEMMTSGPAGRFGGMGMALGRLNGELELTPEQREKAEALFKAHQQRQTERSRAAVERLKQDPTSLMKLMLASDASARGEMGEEEYKSVQEEAGKSLMGVINPLDRKNMGGGSPLRDPEFANDFRAILDPTQSAKFDESMAKRQAEATTDPNTVAGVEEGNIAGLPKMELEKLDTSIESARKITTGIKSMMDGMGGLREMMEPPAGGGDP